MADVGGVGAVGGIGSFGAVGGVATSGSIAIESTNLSSDSGSPSTIVSLGQNSSPSMFGNPQMNGVNAYSAIQSLDSVSINSNYISQQTNLSVDYINGFVAGLGMNEQLMSDKLTDALIIMLLLEKMNKR